jgi:hypothetical protein
MIIGKWIALPVIGKEKSFLLHDSVLILTRINFLLGK